MGMGGRIRMAYLYCCYMQILAYWHSDLGGRAISIVYHASYHTHGHAK